MRQSGLDSGLDFHVEVLKTFQVGPSLLGSGWVVPRYGIRSVSEPREKN
jgi:hypothetical protein